MNHIIDFYADFNENGYYDPPPADHAWRLLLDDANGDTSLEFTHNTSFTDINWKHELTVRFTSMNPHVGQELNLRVVKADNLDEIIRTKMDSIDAPAFNVYLPAIMPEMNHVVDFYVDFNENGQYDPPPVDHAWRLAIDNARGDTTLDFVHNTNFTDIQWPAPTRIVSGENQNKMTFQLYPNHPNPFNPVTKINFTIQQRGQVRLTILNLLGQPVRTLVDATIKAGQHTLSWDGRDEQNNQLPTGMYFYCLTYNQFHQAGKMMLLR
jgi:hypothetical protein